MSDIRPESTTETAPTQPVEKISPRGMAAVQGNLEKPQTSLPEKKSEWVDHGIVNVPVADLPDPDGVSGPQDFNHHISWEDAKAASGKLPDLQKQIAAGKTGDDFSAQDQANGLDYAHGTRKFYDLYYGSDPVVLNKVGNDYDIVSGRHRIFAAKDQGLETIPAWVKEKLR